MARHDGMREKKCGCLIFEVGPPVLCAKHQSKANRKAEKAREAEEKGLRKIVVDQATDNGHDLSRFKEYGSCPGKWVAHCHRCGTLAIVYERVPERGDQVNAAGLLTACRKSDLFGTLADAEREAVAARFASKVPLSADSDDGETNAGVED